MKQLASWVNIQLTAPVDHLTIGPTLLKGPWYEVARIHFPLNRSGLDTQDIGRLKFLANRYATMLGTTPRLVELVFVGTADPSGTVSHNQALSERRAELVSDRFNTELSAVVEPWALVFIRVRSFGVGASWAATATDPTDLNNPMRWRRVGIYANLPLQWIEAGIQRLKQGYRKAAQQALAGHREGIEALKRNIKAYEQRAKAVGGSKVYSFAFLNLTWELERLEETEARFEELLAAIDKGTDPFVEWMRRRRPFLDFLKSIVADLKKERARIAAEALKSPADPEINDLLQWMDHDINRFNQDIQDYETGKITSG